MSESERVRLEIVVERKDGETATDAGVRAKRLLRGMEREPFGEVEVRRTRYVNSDSDHPEVDS